MRASAAAVVTTEQRVEWLRSRRWLPPRPVAFAPVYSNLPPPSPGVEVDELLLGLFGYAYEGANGGLVLDALARAARRAAAAPRAARRPGARYADGGGLAGRGPAPGRAATAIEFSGRLPAQELSDALARCAVLLCAASPGPTSRKGTLAASLASGRPVVAIDGHLTWGELREQDAARVVAADAAAHSPPSSAPAGGSRRAGGTRRARTLLPRAPHGRRLHGAARSGCSQLAPAGG